MLRTTENTMTQPRKRKTTTGAKRKRRVKGSPKRLAKQLMHMSRAKVQRDSDGKVVRDAKGKILLETTRHEKKKEVRSLLEADGISATSHNIAKMMPIYGLNTADNYQRIWERFFTYASREHGINDVAKIKRHHVKDFLQDTINSGIKYRSFKAYLAALNKLETAMNRVKNYPMYYSQMMDDMRVVAKGSLEHKLQPRGYNSPDHIITAIENETYQLAAHLQFDGGARISEVSELQLGRNLRGVKDGRGHILLTNTKGGRERDIYIRADLYKKIENIAKQDGKFQFVRRNYRYALKKAVLSTGEDWKGKGSHGLRWNYVQHSFQRHQIEHGMSFNEALQTVALEIGHSRPEITLHYLQ